ncbi:MocR-like pyridoxine biosynthesis transcription factor PdxR [Geodermatophilus sp. URMC 60]
MTLLPFPWEAARGPVSHRLAAALRAAITDGRLVPGERLPASRTLAEDLRVSRWVVTEVYDQLKAEGYLTARTGSGTTVSATHRPRAIADVVREPSSTPSAEVDLSPNLPDLRSFPRAMWKAALRRAVDSLTVADLGYPQPLGDRELRRVLADHLRRVRGLDADPADVVVTSGTAHSLGLLFRVLAAGGGRRLGVEDPSWPRLLQTARRVGLERVPVPVDERGLQVDVLDDLALDAVCVAPAHQFPTGVVLAPERRERLLSWAGADRLVVEDDYDAEFRYGRPPVAALASLQPDAVAYLGSTSKTLVPAVRIGWMVLSGRHRRAVERVLTDERAGPSTIEQRALALLLADGGYDRHVRRMRRAYRARRAGLVTALSGVAPELRVRGLDAGLHLLLEVPPDDERALAAELVRRGLRVMAVGDCRLTSTGPSGVLVGYGNLPTHRIPEVARTIATALHG